MPHSHLLCKRPACYPSTSKSHVRDNIFKSSSIHASLIINFPEFAEFSESSAPFRKNSNMHITLKAPIKFHSDGESTTASKITSPLRSMSSYWRRCSCEQVNLMPLIAWKITLSQTVSYLVNVPLENVVAFALAFPQCNCSFRP